MDEFGFESEPLRDISNDQSKTSNDDVLEDFNDDNTTHVTPTEVKAETIFKLDKLVPAQYSEVSFCLSAHAVM